MNLKPKDGRSRCGAIMLYCLFSLPPIAQADIVIDGVFDESEWSAAIRCGEWQRTQPFGLDTPRYRNDIRIVATSTGLAAAFVMDQPPEERRVKPRVPRDAESMAGEWVALMVDFDATGQVGFEFTVGLSASVRDGMITNQNSFNRDWDGVWRHAVRETETQWFVEMLIPWSTVNMNSSGKRKRDIGIFATRYLYDHDELYSCPGVARDGSTFLSEFRRIEIEQHTAANVVDVVPYASWLADRVDDSDEGKAGVDIVWKPSQNFRLAAALNPDFGHVESDELVVNFSAVESVFADKRPFFSENQAIFDLRTPANGQLVYTRRVGAPPDNASTGASDIDAAIKLTGTAGPASYGALIAQEDDYDRNLGRTFTATRVALPLTSGRIGYLGTWTDRPLLSRRAWVNALDYEWKASDRFRLATQAIRSDISVADSTESGYEAWMQTDFNSAAPLSHYARFLYIDDGFDMNDFGYLERDNLRQSEWDTLFRRANAGTSSRINGESLRAHLVYRENGHAERLKSGITLTRDVKYRSGWQSYQQFGYNVHVVDDVISRGNGPVQVNPRTGAYFDITTARLGNWKYLFGGNLFQQGVTHYSGTAEISATWYADENFTARLRLLPEISRDWLLWRGGNSFGSYRSKRLTFDMRLDWIPVPRHELRIRWQWIGIDADLRASYRTTPSGRLYRTDDALAPFIVSNLGLQVRYRFEIGPMSDLYVVYGRGGSHRFEDDERNVEELYRDMFDVRDVDQFLIKLRYRL